MARGFSSLPKERMREIASMGGRASQNGGRSHRWNAEEAAAAGRKGGAKVASDPDYMARIGKIGGLRRVARLRAEKAAAAREPAEQQAAESEGWQPAGDHMRARMAKKAGGVTAFDEWLLHLNDCRGCSALGARCATGRKLYGGSEYGMPAQEASGQQAAESDGVKVDGGKLREGMPVAAHDPPRPMPPEVRAPVQPAVVDPVEAAAKARADRRRLLIERGSAWHQQAAAYTASLPSTSPEQCPDAALDEGAE